MGKQSEKALMQISWQHACLQPQIVCLYVNAHISVLYSPYKWDSTQEDGLKCTKA